jgi:SEC-C motif
LTDNSKKSHRDSDKQMPADTRIELPREYSSMRLPAENVKGAILHPDKQVRTRCAHYFSGGMSDDPAVMPVVIEAIEGYGWEAAFDEYWFMERLVQTEETVAWLIRQIQQSAELPYGVEPNRLTACTAALTQADPVVLERHMVEIANLDSLGEETQSAIEERVWFMSRFPDELWEDLEELCGVLESEDYPPDDEFDFACRVVEALGRHHEQSADRVLAILRGEEGVPDPWTEVFAIRLAGELQLTAAIPQIIEILHTDDDFGPDEAHLALVRMKTDDVVTQLAREWQGADVWSRMSIACILEDIHSDESVEFCFELLDGEPNHRVQCQLFQSILLNFDTAGIEPAREFILESTIDPDLLEVRSALLALCKVSGERFPEFEAWVADSANDAVFRDKWYDEHDPPPEEWLDDDPEPELVDTIPREARRPAAPDDDIDDRSGSRRNGKRKQRSPGRRARRFERRTPARLNRGHRPIKIRGDEHSPARSTTFVRSGPHIGRNDRCPCGSGKKYKKCCLGQNGKPARNRLSAPPGIGGITIRQSAGQYPIGKVVLYGPDDKQTTKIVAAVIKREGGEPILQRWVGGNVLNNPRVSRQIQEFFEKHPVKSVVRAGENSGCPHEEGTDFPPGEECPLCPFWKGKLESRQAR